MSCTAQQRIENAAKQREPVHGECTRGRQAPSTAPSDHASFAKLSLWLLPALLCSPLRSDTTISALKLHLQSTYPSSPSPSSQRLIFEGRLLGDEERLGDILASSRLPSHEPRKMHLAIRGQSVTQSETITKADDGRPRSSTQQQQRPSSSTPPFPSSSPPQLTNHLTAAHNPSILYPQPAHTGAMYGAGGYPFAPPAAYPHHAAYPPLSVAHAAQLAGSRRCALDAIAHCFVCRCRCSPLAVATRRRIRRILLIPLRRLPRWPLSRRLIRTMRSAYVSVTRAATVLPLRSLIQSRRLRSSRHMRTRWPCINSSCSSIMRCAQR